MGNKVDIANSSKPVDGSEAGTLNPVKHEEPEPLKLNAATGHLNKKERERELGRRNLTQAAKEQMKDALDGLDDARKKIEDIQYQDYEYPFENIVLEGGGAKGIAYVGALRALDEVGIKITRFAGASAGSICAALAAVGYTTDEMEVLLSKNIADSINDHKCGICSLLPNLVRGYGWNPGKVFIDDIGQYIAAKSDGNADLTFKQLLKTKEVELCVIATNLNMLSVEYFHPKTTPDMPIKQAVRISSSIPGILQAVRIPESNNKFTTYIDGGILCNYAIHAFDGWWLSMDVKDSFLHKITDLNSMQSIMEKKNRFGSFNEKTVGFLVYSSLEQEVMQAELQSRVGIEIEKRPDTALYRKRKEALAAKLQAQAEHEVFINTLNKFLDLLKKENIGPDGTGDDVIDKRELKQVINKAVMNSEEKVRILEAERLEKRRIRRGLSQNDSESYSDDSGDDPENDLFTTAHVEILFGSDRTLDEIFDELDENKNGTISFDELVKFIEKSGISIQAKFQGYDRKDVTNLKEFAISLQDCLLTNVKRVFMEETDLMRTVGINTDYLETTDFVMEEEDRKFLIEQGYKATVSYLKHYVSEKNPPKKPDVSTTDSSTTTSSQVITSQPMTPAFITASTDGQGKKTLPPIRGQAATPMVQMAQSPILAGPDLYGRRPKSVDRKKTEQPTTTTSLDSTDSNNTH